jgi:hypothetical protein
MNSSTQSRLKAISMAFFVFVPGAFVASTLIRRRGEIITTSDDFKFTDKFKN